ncbi:hypothetical protein AB4Y36_01535 [Paraburkholderia sp. BR10936]|uniref:hypothetical protein n=1 Tax=Paraburkholderia sp. BR10936 TaxID=3236993 RepID=UPI0034D313CF
MRRLTTMRPVQEVRIMANEESNAVSPVSAEQVRAVANRCGELYFAFVGMWEMCDRLEGQGDAANTISMFKELLRSAARDMETCHELLTHGKTGSSGNFADYFGAV